MNFTILGSGFGLYGYLPALIRCGHDVTLPARYRKIIHQRGELRGLSGAIRWRDSEADIRKEVDALVISRRPVDQSSWLHEYLEKNTQVTAVILEKPLGVSPASARDLLTALEKSDLKYRIAYTFRFLPWAESFRTVAQDKGSLGHIEIVWRFRSYHYRQDLQNWKRRISEGGGALRFFGIHIIGLLSEIGYCDVQECHYSASSQDECEAWFASFLGPNLKECRVLVDSNSDQTEFAIKNSDGRKIIDQSDPFQSIRRRDGLDNRVEILELLCKSLNEAVRFYPWYAASIKLWKQTELLSQQVRDSITPDSFRLTLR